MTIGWSQNAVILDAELTAEERAWYISAVRQFGWSKRVLADRIAERACDTMTLDMEVSWQRKPKKVNCISKTKSTRKGGAP